MRRTASWSSHLASDLVASSIVASNVVASSIVPTLSGVDVVASASDMVA